MKKDILIFAGVLIILLFSIGTLSLAYSVPLIIDHACTDLSKVPEQWIKQAKRTLHIAYGHTSHGSQLISGMQGLVNAKGNLYAFNYGGKNDALDLHDLAFSSSGHDLGHKGDTRWAHLTRKYLDNPKNSRCNVVAWSWCGGVSDNTLFGINRYLKIMDKLESEYPKVMFVYMTGHLDGSGENGNLHRRNKQIRYYCNRNQ